MTDADNKPTPFPTRPVYDIPPLGRDARDSNSLAPARPQNGNMSVGPGIQLKGEISKCATLVVDGDVDATLDGTALEIAQRGVFCGTARVESASIQGRFEGDLTVSGMLRIENGGSVSGKLCYGRLEVTVGGEFLQSFDVPELRHRGSVGSETVRHDCLWSTMTFLRALQALERSPAIPALCRENLEHLAFVINSPPQVVRFATNPDEHLIEVPAPLRKRPMMNALFPDRSREHGTEAVPPEPHRLVADIDTSFEQQIFDLSQRERIPDVHHHREADHLGRTVEITEGIAHPETLNFTRHAGNRFTLTLPRLPHFIG